MSPSKLVLAGVLCLATSALAQSERKIEYLEKEPPPGSLPRGKVVYVDDRTCPKGEVKEITGGSKDKSLLRTVRCVKRPG